MVEESCIREDTDKHMLETYNIESSQDSLHRHRTLIKEARTMLSDDYVKLLKTNLSFMSSYAATIDDDGTVIVRFANESNAEWATRMANRTWRTSLTGECPGCRYHTGNCGLPCTVTLVCNMCCTILLFASFVGNRLLLSTILTQQVHVLPA